MASTQGREQISAAQVTALFVLSRLSLTLVYYGAPAVVRQDAWWQSGLAATTGALFVWLLHWLWRRFPGKGLPQIGQAVLGRFAGRWLALMYAVFYLLLYTLNLRLTGDFFLYAFLPRTPLLVIILVTAFLTMWAARAGVEVVARAAQLLIPLVVGTVVAVAALLIREVEPGHLWPSEILHTGPIPHLQDMISVAARTVELAWLSLLCSHVPRTNDLVRGAVRAWLWLGLIWVPLGAVIYGALGRDAEVHLYPFFTAAQLISIANFVERFDSIILAVWLQGMVIRSGMLLWASARETAAGFGLRDYRPLVIPLAALAVAYAVPQAESQNELMGFLGPETLTPFTLLFVLVIPMLLLAVAAIRGVRGSRRVQSQL